MVILAGFVDEARYGVELPLCHQWSERACRLGLLRVERVDDWYGLRALDEPCKERGLEGLVDEQP